MIMIISVVVFMAAQPTIIEDSSLCAATPGSVLVLSNSFEASLFSEQDCFDQRSSSRRDEMFIDSRRPTHVLAPTERNGGPDSSALPETLRSAEAPVSLRHRCL